MVSNRSVFATAIACLAVSVLLFRTRPASAAEQATPAGDLGQLILWVEQPADASKLPPSKTYSIQDQPALQAFIPQPAWQLYFYPGMAMEVVPMREYPIGKDFIAASASNQGHTTLDPDGEIHGYSGFGFPFEPARLDAADPQIALKVMWDFWYRPGQDDYYMPMQMRLRNASGKDDRVMEFVATDNFYTGHNDLPGGRLVPGENDVESKMWMSFEKPKDLWGTQMILTKYLDHHRDDDLVVFTRKERRTRRMSAAERMDPWMGTDLLTEDFYGFSGQLPEWKWRYVGRRRILATMNVQSNVEWGGPHGWVPQGARWEMRDCYVIDGTPRNSADPYSHRVLFIDTQRFWVLWMIGYDHDGHLWKSYQHTLAWANDYHPSVDSKGNPTMRYCRFEANRNGNKILHVGETMVDLKRREATQAHCYTCCYKMTGKEAVKIYSDQRLGEQ